MIHCRPKSFKVDIIPLCRIRQGYSEGVKTV